MPCQPRPIRLPLFSVPQLDALRIAGHLSRTVIAVPLQVAVRPHAVENADHRQPTVNRRRAVAAVEQIEVGRTG